MSEMSLNKDFESMDNIAASTDDMSTFDMATQVSAKPLKSSMEVPTMPEIAEVPSPKKIDFDSMLGKYV
jgi:hypothetical protein